MEEQLEQQNEIKRETNDGVEVRPTEEFIYLLSFLFFVFRCSQCCMMDRQNVLFLLLLVMSIYTSKRATTQLNIASAAAGTVKEVPANTPPMPIAACTRGDRQANYLCRHVSDSLQMQKWQHASADGIGTAGLLISFVFALDMAAFSFPPITLFWYFFITYIYLYISVYINMHEAALLMSFFTASRLVALGPLLG